MQVMTVLGPIAPAALGITQTHEHLIFDGYAVTHSYEAVLEDEELAVEELAYFKQAGGNTIVEVTNIGIGRDPLALQRIARAAGVNVVMGSAWYREVVYPSYIQEKTADALAEIIVRDLTEGVDGTGIRAGVIGEIGTERHYITPAQERVFRAAARAHKRTSAPIMTHTTHLGELAMEQLALLREEGVDLRRVIVSHLGDRRHIDLELPLAQAGAYVQFDHVGFASWGHDWQRAECVAKLIQAGHLDRILLSLDLCRCTRLHWYGGEGYDYLLKTFVPLLKKAGVTEEQIHTILVENPQRALAY